MRNSETILGAIRYFSGILTMFFTSDVTLPFESIKDVMRAYPDWRLRKQQ